MLVSECTRRVIGLAVVLLSAASALPQFFSPAFAQTATPAARKVEEFGDVYPTDMAARLDNFAITLQNEPGARAFMIVYRSHRDLPGINGRHLNWMKGYLINSRGIKSDLIVTIDGGTASCLSHELWLVPAGATPVPRPDAYSRGLEDADLARKFDEYFFSAPEDNLVSYGTEYEGSMEGFANALRREPRSLAYVIAYEGYRVETWDETDGRGRRRTHRRVHVDTPGTARRKLAANKTELVRKHGIAPSRIRLVNGGHRKWRRLELWIVPRGAHAPMPTPNTFPRGRRR